METLAEVIGGRKAQIGSNLEHGMIGVAQQKSGFLKPQIQNVLNRCNAVTLLKIPDETVFIQSCLIGQKIQMNIFGEIIREKLMDPGDHMAAACGRCVCSGIHHRFFSVDVEQKDAHNMAAHFLIPCFFGGHLCNQGGKHIDDGTGGVLKVAVEVTHISDRGEKTDPGNSKADIFKGGCWRTPFGMLHVGIDKYEIHRADVELLILDEEGAFSLDTEK